jgi:hypothetical protein
VSVTLRPAERPAGAPAPQRPLRAWREDALVLGLLALLLAVIAALTWQKWGGPEIDAGAELTTADLVAHGAVPYQDVRYFYGPLGLYGLAGAFDLLGTSFTVAFAFGFAQTVAILGAFYALARQWLTPRAAGAATAVLLAIAFGGTASDFVLPHTNSATMGILFLLLSLLALARRRLVWAGVAAGLVCLTRPEFAAIEAGMLGVYLFGVIHERGWRAALASGVRIAVPAVAIPAIVFGALSAQVGASRLFTENLWPVDFLRETGFQSQSFWMPFDFESLVGAVARGALYGGLLAGFVASVARWRDGARLRALVPLGVAVGALALADAVARAGHVYPSMRSAIEHEAAHAVIGMAALPALAAAVAVWAVVRLVRRGPSPFGGSWPVDLALIAAAAALGLRAYNAFTPEGSYAPYYAAPALLVAALLHREAARRWPKSGGAAVLAMTVIALGMLGYSLHALYGDESMAVHTARGTFKAEPAAASVLGKVTAEVRRTTAPGEKLLAAPSEGGLYFMTDRRPALYELMLLPGLLASKADEEHAAARLREQDVRTVAIAARDYRAFGAARFGRDFDRTLGRRIDAATTSRTVIGTLEDPAGGTYMSRGFTLLRLAW